jgi:hypothetical protein
MMSSPNPLTDFLVLLQTTVAACYSLGEGKLLITCRKSARDGQVQEYRLSAYGLLQAPHRVAQQHVDQYVEQYLSQNSPRLHLEIGNLPFGYLETGLLKILQASGHGEVAVEFEPDRKGKIVMIGRMTMSDRFVLGQG